MLIQCSKLMTLDVEKCHLLAEFRNVLQRWNNHFCQALNIHVHGFNCVWKVEMHTAESLVPQSGCSEAEPLDSEIHKLINNILNEKGFL
jgi:hypothetical protein